MGFTGGSGVKNPPAKAENPGGLGSGVKNPPAKAGNTGGVGWIPGLGRCSGEGNGSPFSILAWEIPWVEEPGGPLSMGSQKRRLSD